jgi:hypothetical protein
MTLGPRLPSRTRAARYPGCQVAGYKNVTLLQARNHDQATNQGMISNQPTHHVLAYRSSQPAGRQALNPGELDKTIGGNARSKGFTLILAVVGCALMIAACGSSSPGSTGAAVGSSGAGTGSSAIGMLDKYSACMRDHGVSGFPDPSTTETPNSFGVDGYNFDLPSTMNTQSPAYEAAGKDCEKLIGMGTSGGGPSAAFVAKARKAALAHAVCMREHGVPNFPDPTVTGHANGITERSGGGGSNPRSPAFQQAEKICQRP